MRANMWLAAAMVAILAGGTRAQGSSGNTGGERVDVNLSGTGWHLWRDAQAKWQQDRLFLPPVDLGQVPTHEPTGGWGVLDDKRGMAVSVPGTAEEYLQTTPGPQGDITGVTWWYRQVTIPRQPEGSSRARILLRFEAARQRAEVYINHHLVGYDVVGNTPFEADLSSVARPGETVQLAVRITDPGGNFDWHDKGLISWGSEKLLMSHGFGGITGRVHLLVCDPVYVEDLYVQNTPAVKSVNVQATLRNAEPTEAVRDVRVEIFEKNRAGGEPVASRTLRAVQVPKGELKMTVPMAVASAKLWDPDHPNLYSCRVTLLDDGRSSDAADKQFGFRWFEAVGIGKDAMFRLNGKRIVLRTAISWGFFPINGIVATPDMAEKQIRAAKAFGLNMLNFHRCIGEPVILENADELGLLYYEEPGNYDSGTNPAQAFAREMAREKVLRMVRRDRSHPSLIIYSMSNETGPNPKELATYKEDMAAMHALDPSRIVLRASGLRSALGMDHPMSTKLHMLPFDDTQSDTGWYDDHHAGGPAVWNQSFYRSPSDFYHLVHDPQEILYWGEEGAISTPPRLGLIKKELEHAPHLGWDGGMYLDWYRMFDRFITEKKLRDAFPTVDSLCEAMGDIAIEHQGRKTQLIRINNESDGYATNGWESEILENHSGIVDCFRNPKGDPALLAYYNQPLYVAVMPRTQVLEAKGRFVVDFFIVNERNVHGAMTLAITGKDSAGHVTFEKRLPVTVAGGDTYGQLLVKGVDIPVSAAQGFFHVEAALEDENHAVKATGHDDVFVTDWQSAPIAGAGAILETDGDLRNFLKQRKNLAPPAYRDALGRLDWVVATAPPNAPIPTLVPAAQFRNDSGSSSLEATFFADRNFTKEAAHHSTDMLDVSVPDGAPADPALDTLANYSIRWKGTLVPPTAGAYTFALPHSGEAGLTINGTRLNTGDPVPKPRKGEPAPRPLPSTIHLEAGQAVPIVVEWKQGSGDAFCRLMWVTPRSLPPSAERLLDRVANDGTTLVLLDHAAEWMPLIAARNPAIHFNGSFIVGRTWAGGDHFVRSHPLFKDLPVSCGMNWPYQGVVEKGDERTGLLVEGDELAAGAFHANTPLAKTPQGIHLGTAVGVVRLGKGRVVFSTLDIVPHLGDPEGPADVARKLLCNFLEYASSSK